MTASVENRTIALAGLFQCTYLAVALARDGRCDPRAFGVCIGSTLKIDAVDYADVYNGLPGIRLGLEQLKSLLVDKTVRSELASMEAVRYALALMELQKRLVRDQAMQDRLKEELLALAQSKETLGEQTVTERLSALYRATISTFTPRIMVQGDPDNLNDERIASQIRSLLLGGIRAASLWRQAGGNRLKMLLERRAIHEACDRLLAKA